MKTKTYSNKTFDQKIKKLRQLLPTIANTFKDFISNNIDHFREVIPNDTTPFFRG